MPSQAQEHAVTLTDPVADLDAFEDVLDMLPEACMVGAVEYGPTADLVLTVGSDSPAGRSPPGLSLLDAGACRCATARG